MKDNVIVTINNMTTNFHGILPTPGDPKCLVNMNLFKLHSCPRKQKEIALNIHILQGETEDLRG